MNALVLVAGRLTVREASTPELQLDLVGLDPMRPEVGRMMSGFSTMIYSYILRCIRLLK
jgi:hypothetical protein